MEKTVIQTIALHQRLLYEYETSGVDKTVKIARLITDSAKSGGTIYICGNGGSAADAQHIAGELVGRFLRERKAIASVALSTDTSVITAIANDYGYEEVFARQVEALIGSEDVLWAFSTSGTSANIIKAVELAKSRGAKIIAFTGKAASKLESLSDACICVDAPYSSAAQEIHQLAYHIICDLVEQQFVSE